MNTPSDLSPSKIPLSVFIIAKDEADRIGRAIQSVQGWVDEIVVVDSGSEDDTLNIARAAGADIVTTHAWGGYGPQKIHAQSLCRNRWLFNLDADEEVSPALKEQILALFTDGAPSQVAYRVDAVQVFPGNTKPHAFSPHTLVVRIFDKDRAGFRNSPVHDSVILHGTDDIPKDTPLLSAPLWHHSFRSLEHMMDKINYYSTMQARDMLARGIHVPRWRVTLEPFLMFLKNYFLRRYFTMGYQGIVYSVMYAAGRTLRLAKVRELYAEQQKR